MKRTTLSSQATKGHKVSVNYRLERPLVEQLQKASEKTGLTKTKILERALAQFLSLKAAA
jgi:predicted transcriptional regulator